MKTRVYISACILSLLWILSFNTNAIAQTYSFLYSSGTYTALSSPTQVHSYDVDDALSASIGIGFTFNYKGSNYTTVKISSNGWINPGASIGSASYSTNDIGSTTNGFPIIAPFWDDLKTGTSGEGGNISYELTGTAPSRVFTVQFKAMRWYYSAANLVNFQVKLYETTNVIDFVYGSMANSPGASANASIGINNSPGGSGNFMSVTPGATPTASTTVANDLITSVASISSGTVYTFAPFTLPTVATSAITPGTTTASGGGNVTSDGNATVTARGVCWNTSTNPTIANSLTSDGSGTGSFSSSLTGLAPETQYYVRAYATNTIGTAYGDNVIFATISSEPTGHAALFNALSSSSTQINLTFSAASGYGADGYIILRRAEDTYPDATGVIDGTAPGSLSLPSGTTLVTAITSSAATSYSNTGLYRGTRYYYIIIPYNWNGSIAGTYNYLTSGSIPNATDRTYDAPVDNLGLIIAGNLVNNGTLDQTNDQHFFVMTGASKIINGTTSTYTMAKLRVSGSITYQGAIVGGSFEKTYIDAAKSLLVDLNKTFINGSLTAVGQLTFLGGSHWKNSGNFKVTAAIGAAPTSTTEFNGTFKQRIISETNTRLGNVIINNSSTPSATQGVILEGELGVKNGGILTLTDGLLILNGNMIIIDDPEGTSLTYGGSNTNWTESWIYGTSNTSCLSRNMHDQADTYAYPIGTATRSQLAVLTTSNTSLGYYYGNIWFNPSPTNLQAGITSLSETGVSYTTVHTDGVWETFDDGNLVGTYDLKLYFNGGFAGLQDFKFGIVTRPDAASNWALNGTAVRTTVAQGYAHRSGMSTFSEKGIGTTDGPLPIELVYFKSSCTDNNSNIISWSTASEIDNNFFVIERSTDMKSWNIIHSISGAGNSNDIRNYSYTDLGINANTNYYYRLTQVDFDGRYETFNPITTNCDNSNKLSINYINSFGNETMLNFSTNNADNVTIEIFNSNYQKIYSSEMTPSIGENTVEINSSDINAGIYMIIIKTSDQSEAQKFVKEK